MKPIRYILFFSFILCCRYAVAQVKTNLNNQTPVLEQGRFAKDYKTQIDFELAEKNVTDLLEAEKRAHDASDDTKPVRIAEPVRVDIDIPGQMNWTTDEKFAYGKFVIRAKGALTTSINFDKFFLPAGTEMYVYNENGNMITGPVTEAENNKGRIWGSWVYNGEYLSIEIKTPLQTRKELVLHTSNIAYGYKQFYRTKVTDFGASGPCNINVICPLGTGWEKERNAVALILRGDGSALCTGSMVMNTCGTTTPYFLTANHCFVGDGNVAAWRFTFQAWSATCDPSQNSAGLTFNGSTLRANNAASDFCLVELNNTPPSNSGIHYAGWSRITSPNAGIEATGIHHPQGDVMKISKANSGVVRDSYGGSVNQHWRVNWSPQNNGAGSTVTAVTEPGSSGSPLFEQNHRIIGQLHGGPSFCGGTQLWDFYGSFDQSWYGGGTNATRLSNWLDPYSTTINITNTTSIANLPLTVASPSGTYIHNGNYTPQNLMMNPSYYGMVIYYNNMCTQATTTMNLPIGTIATWTFKSASPASPPVYWYPTGNNLYVTLPNNQSAVFEVTYTAPCGAGSSIPYLVGFRGSCSGGGYYYRISPNPVSSMVRVVVDENRAKEKDAQGAITMIAIYDQQGMLKQQRRFGKVREAAIDVSQLYTGIYIIEITNGDYKERQQLSVRK